MHRISARTLVSALAALVVAMAVPTALLADSGHSNDSATSGQSNGKQPKPPENTDDKYGDTTAPGHVRSRGPRHRACRHRHAPVDQPAPAPKPTYGKNVVVAPSKGTIAVMVPGSHSFHALGDGGELPVGAVVDARHGRITLSSATDDQGGGQTASFWGGVFQVRQAKDGVTELVLRGPKPSCSTRSGRAVASAVRRRGAGLWGHDNARQVPHPRQQQRRDGPRHDLVRPGALRRDLHQGHPRRSRRARHEASPHDRAARGPVVPRPLALTD